jgi:hypothetical protein
MKFCFFILVIFFICAFSLTTYALDRNGLVLYLSFDEGSGKIAKDGSGKKNDGELVGNVQWVDGKVKKAIKVMDDSANNLVSVKANKTLDITDQITFGAWVNVETIPDGSCALMTKADTYMFHSSNWSGKGIEQEPLLWPFDVWQTAISAPIQLNEWHHIMGVFDGKNLSNYIDGKLINSRAFANKITVTANDLIIGRDSRACCNTRRITQAIDELMIFNRALAANEVKETMAGGGISVESQGRLANLWGEIKVGF